MLGCNYHLRLNIEEGFTALLIFLEVLLQIEITQDCAINGEHTPAGTVVDLSDNDALAVINMGKATPYEGKAKSKDRSVGLTTETAAPLKKRSRKK